jgi:hypothetical protein
MLLHGVNSPPKITGLQAEIRGGRCRISLQRGLAVLVFGRDMTAFIGCYFSRILPNTRPSPLDAESKYNRQNAERSLRYTIYNEGFKIVLRKRDTS